MNRPLSFRAYLTALIVITATVPLVLVSYPLVHLVEGIYERLSISQLRLLAETSARETAQELEYARISAQSLAHDSDLQRGAQTSLFVDKAEFLMEAYRRDHPLVSQVLLFDNQGDAEHLVANIPNGAPVLQEPTLARAPEPGESARFELRPDDIWLKVPVESLLRHPVGLLLARISRAHLGQDIAQHARPPYALTLRQTGTPLPAAIREDVQAQAPIELTGGQPLELAATEPRSVQAAEIRANVWQIAAFAGLAILLMGGLGLWIARRTVRPIRRLSDQVRQYSLGHYEVPAPPMDFLEFSEIAGLLGVMSAQIQSQLQDAAERERTKGQIERTRMEAELLSLRQQMQPHFLFNVLNNISSQISSNPADAQRMISMLSDLYRLVLDSSGDQSGLPTLTLERELSIAQKYLELQQMRFGARLQFSIDCPPAAGRLPVPSLMIQTLIENALKHGVSNAREGGRVEVVITLEAPDDRGTSYVCEVRNSGAPLRVDPRPALGTGLANTRKRLALLFGETEANFEISSRRDGWTVARFRFGVGSREKRSEQRG